MTVGKRIRRRRITARQVEILQAVADGDDYDEIASALFITKPTVSKHVGAISIHLRATNTANAVAEGIRQGVIR